MPPSLKPTGHSASLKPTGKSTSVGPTRNSASLEPARTSASLKPTGKSASLDPSAHAPNLNPTGKPKILLIDDDRILMERTAVYLTAKGFLVTTSENVFTIASTIGSERPDAIVLDVRMPALGGDKVASVLSRLCTLPIVFYSAVDDEDGEALAASHQNARFVSKGAGLRCLWERLVEITGSGTPAVGL